MWLFGILLPGISSLVLVFFGGLGTKDSERGKSHRRAVAGMSFCATDPSLCHRKVGGKMMSPRKRHLSFAIKGQRNDHAKLIVHGSDMRTAAGSQRDRPFGSRIRPS